MTAIVREDPDWQTFAGEGWTARIFGESVPDREHRKQGRAIGRWTLTDSAGRTLIVFLKRHFVLPKWAGLLARLFPGRAWSPGLQEWEHLSWAEREGFPVPRAMAAGEFRGPGLRLKSFLAIEELAEQEPLHLAVPIAQQSLSAADFERWKRGVLLELARLSRELHRRRYFHCDLYFCHFYLHRRDLDRVPDDWTGRIAMIDFHRLMPSRWLWPWQQAKDLGQLLYSSDVPGVTDRDRRRFWIAYRRGDWHGATKPPNWLLRFIDWKARQYHGAAERRAKRSS